MQCPCVRDWVRDCSSLTQSAELHFVVSNFRALPVRDADREIVQRTAAAAQPDSFRGARRVRGTVSTPGTLTHAAPLRSSNHRVTCGPATIA